MNIRLGWGPKLALLLAGVIVPLGGALLLQSHLDQRRAERMATAFPDHLAAIEARNSYRVFVDGMTDALDSGKVGSAALKALARTAATVHAVAAHDAEPSLADLDRALATLAASGRSADPTAALVAQGPAIGLTGKAIEQFDERLRARMAQTIDEAGLEARQSQWAALAAAAVIALGAAAFVNAMGRRLTRPLHAAIGLAEAVAAGRLVRTDEARGHDETATLLRALGRMTGELGHIVDQVRRSSSDINATAAEVASGTENLSGRTIETAMNLQQTASGVDRLRETIQANAASTEQASQAAARAAGVADQGGRVVGQVVQTMQRIAEQSRRIGDITGVIDAIAFQTNILALNAAVEAARAGEQGRGFAVVAGEVRALARRSAEAAREIKALIGSSLEQVTSGSAQAADAGHTMHDIVDQVREVSGLMAQIDRASSVQADAISQLNAAVQALEGMTQQNAQLVQASAIAADSLKAQGATLASTVAVFQTA